MPFLQIMLLNNVAFFSRINHKGEFYYDKRLNVDVEKVKAPESDVMKITVRYKF